MENDDLNEIKNRLEGIAKWNTEFEEVTLKIFEEQLETDPDFKIEHQDVSSSMH